MCDYSLDLVASRPAKVGDELVTTEFQNSMTRGFAAIGEPNVAVCLLPSTEIAVKNEVEYERFFTLLPNMKLGEESGAIPADQCGQAEGASRCAGVPRRGDRAAHPHERRPTRNRAAVAGSEPKRLPPHPLHRQARNLTARARLAAEPGSHRRHQRGALLYWLVGYD